VSFVFPKQKKPGSSLVANQSSRNDSTFPSEHDSLRDVSYV
jgi:hypothetical protein